jgi:hypothetical protein
MTTNLKPFLYTTKQLDEDASRALEVVERINDRFDALPKAAGNWLYRLAEHVHAAEGFSETKSVITAYTINFTEGRA